MLRHIYPFKELNAIKICKRRNNLYKGLPPKVNTFQDKMARNPAINPLTSSFRKPITKD